MKLFDRLFGYILFGVIVLIATAEYLSYTVEIGQYETDMVSNAIQDGKSVSGMIVHVWKESGEEKAKELLADASNAGDIALRWIWLDALSEKSIAVLQENELLENLKSGEIVSVKKQNKNGDILQYTYVPVKVDDSRQGALELSQTLVLLKAYKIKMMVRGLAISFLLALICGLIFYFFIDRKIRVPLNRLMAQAKRIGDGDFRADEIVVGNDELTNMARIMNDMCSRLLIAKEKITFESNARLRTIEQLRHTERLSTFGLLSADIAHEIGTPLNVVDGRAKMIISEDLSPEEIKDCAIIIKSQSERMTLIIRQLLDFTRRPKQHVSLVNIALHIKQIFQLLYPMASKQHVSFDLDKPDDIQVLLNCDGAQIQQVLINLLMNSVQAMPDGGKVHVYLSNETQPSSLKEGGDYQKYLNIRIVDEGEGISQEHIAHIFTPFFTTKTIGTGTGLGLSIAHGIVEEHDGWIDVESDGQSGTCFSVHLPFRESVEE